MTRLFAADLAEVVRSGDVSGFGACDDSQDPLTSRSRFGDRIRWLYAGEENFRPYTCL